MQNSKERQLLELRLIEAPAERDRWHGRSTSTSTFDAATKLVAALGKSIAHLDEQARLQELEELPRSNEARRS